MNRKSMLHFPILASALLLGTPAHAGELPTSTPEQEGISAEKLEQVDEVMNGFVSDRIIAGGTVIIARHGKVVFNECYGLKHLESREPISEDTIFRIYSMSKAITSSAALILADDGKLDLNAPVSRYLPEFAELQVLEEESERPAQHEMTVTDLFLHTSGIIYGSAAGSDVEKMFEVVNVLDKNSDLSLMTTKLGQIPLAFDPGQDWQYGASSDVLGRVVEVASGQALDEFLRTRIFAPLGMDDTGFYVPPEKQDRFAANYYSDNQGRLIIRDEPTKSRYLKMPGLQSGGGGLVGTAADYMRFLLMIERGGAVNGTRILSPESVGLMTTNQLPEQAGWVTFGEDVQTGVGFGFGFSVATKPLEGDPHARQDEYGWGGAASTHYWISPRDELVVVTMEQCMPFTTRTEDALKPIIYDAIIK